MQPDAEKKQRPIDQEVCEARDRGRCAHREEVRVGHDKCRQQRRMQMEGQTEAPRSEVLGVRRVREGAGDGVQRRTGIAALEVVAARAAPRQQRLHGSLENANRRRGRRIVADLSADQGDQGKPGEPGHRNK